MAPCWSKCQHGSKEAKLNQVLGGVTIHQGITGCLCRCGFSRSRFLKKAVPDSIDIALSSWLQVEIAPWVPCTKLSVELMRAWSPLVLYASTFDVTKSPKGNKKIHSGDALQHKCISHFADLFYLALSFLEPHWIFHSPRRCGTSQNFLKTPASLKGNLP